LGLQRGIPALAGWLLGWHAVRDGDVFWHMMLGRAVLRHGSRVVPEPSAHPAWTDPCHVKEWLWDLGCYGLFLLGGMPLVSLLPSVFGALIGYRVARLLERTGESGQPGARLPDAELSWGRTALAVLAVVAVAELLDARPNLVFLTFLPWCCELARRYTLAVSSRERSKLGLALVALELLWAQLHSSYAFGPLLFAAVVAEAWLLRTSAQALSRAAIARAGAVLLGMLAALLTSTHGLGAFELSARHVGGDATRHIQDMQRFDWTQFTALWHTPVIITLFVLLGVAGVLIAGRRAAQGVTLALIGLLATFNVTRMVFPWALLCLPWAGTGFSVLARAAAASSRMRRLELCLGAAVAVTLVLAVQRVDELAGPFLRVGLRPGDQPEAAARYLARLPRGSTVFSEYTIGAPLGFWLDGRVRTFVDSRTPLYFDDTDWALARDMLATPVAMERGFARYGFAAAVVARGSSLCPLLAQTWTPVVLEAGFTTFVPGATGAAGATAAAGLEPCGRMHIRFDACRDGGVALQRTLAAQRRIMDSPFLQLMRVGAQLQCRRGVPDPRAMPDEDDSRAVRDSWRLYAAWTLLANGRGDDALDVIRAGLADDDPLAARVLLDPAAGEISLEDAQDVLARAITVMDDNAPPALRSRLALICRATEDPECIRFHGLRAWLAGDRTARPALEWAASNHPDARARADLRAWLAQR
jgi:hypothetical protein